MGGFSQGCVVVEIRQCRSSDCFLYGCSPPGRSLSRRSRALARHPPSAVIPPSSPGRHSHSFSFTIHLLSTRPLPFSTMAEISTDLTPKFAPFIGMGGIAFAMIFGCTYAALCTSQYIPTTSTH